jgi:calcineurin-like phosphoesterase family protein
MTYWFTSDTHFGHSNIIEYCNRPFGSVEEMDKTIIDNWNSVVKPKDVVFHLGDFSFGKTKEYKDKLNGTIIHIKGNHDSSDETIIQDLLIEHGGKFWHLAHKPEDCCGEFNLCGHVHEKWKVKGNTVNVGVDQWNFTPIDINQILEAIK